MPETVAEIAPVSEQSTVNTEIARQMEIALNGGFAPEPKTEDVAAATTPPAPSAPPDIFQPFKEKFGYNTPEDALAEIEQLRQYKNNPQPPTLEFENEESEKLFKAFAGGRKDEVYNYLERAIKIDNYLTKEINEDSAADIVKLGMQLKNKDLTPAEIDWKFKRQFSIPSKPSQSSDEDDNDYKERVSNWEAQVQDKKMELMIEAKLARPEIEGAKSKLVLPEIDSPADEGYLQYKKALEEDKRLAVEATEAYKVFTPKSIETKLNFKDEANKIDFEFQYEPDAESFAKAKDMVSDINLFWNNFFNKDGSPNRQKFLDAVYFASNKEKVLAEAMKQAKNAAIKAMLPDNTQGGLVRQLTQNQVEESDLDKQFRQHGYTRQ